MGRLRSGVSLAQAQAALGPAFQQWVAGMAANDRQRGNLPALVVKEGAGGLDSLRRQYSQPLYVLMALVGLILAGRDFEENDRPGSPAVAVINEMFAKANLGDRNPLGQHLILQKDGRLAHDMEIVGVSRNARYGSLTRDIPPAVYMPYNQGYPQPDQMVYALRMPGNPLLYVNSIREIVHQADARVPVSEVRTQAGDIDQTINQEITFAELRSGFAILALVIACVGFYGTVSYNVARRTGEISIRMALKAQRGGIVRMVLREVLVLVAVGCRSAWPRR